MYQMEKVFLYKLPEVYLHYELSGPGYGGIADVLKMILSTVCKPLLYILNLSLIQGVGVPMEL